MGAVPLADASDNVPDLLDPAIVSEMRAAWTDGAPRFSASDEGLTAEFFINVYDYARQWLEEHDGPVAGSAPCVFVQARSIVQQSAELSATEISYFASLPDQDVAGRIFIATADFSMVHEVPAGPCDGVLQVADLLKTIGLSDQMHAVFRPDRGELILCDTGLKGKSRRIVVSTAQHKRFTALELEKEVWRFHRMFTQTPSGLLICWRGKSADRLTIEKLERQVSALLTFFIMLSVGSDNVTMEDFTAHGRADIYINVHGMAAGIGGCILELKILRSREFLSTAPNNWKSVSEKKMIDHASDGVMQAREYLDDKRANLGYLLCFDARMSDVEQPTVLLLAASQGIKVGRYFMYDSPASARSARLSAAVSGTRMSGEPPL